MFQSQSDEEEKSNKKRNTSSLGIEIISHINETQQEIYEPIDDLQNDKKIEHQEMQKIDFMVKDDKIYTDKVIENDITNKDNKMILNYDRKKVNREDIYQRIQKNYSYDPYFQVHFLTQEINSENLADAEYKERMKQIKEKQYIDPELRFDMVFKNKEKLIYLSRLIFREKHMALDMNTKVKIMHLLKIKTDLKNDLIKHLGVWCNLGNTRYKQPEYFFTDSSNSDSQYKNTYISVDKILNHDTYNIVGTIPTKDGKNIHGINLLLKSNISCAYENGKFKFQHTLQEDQNMINFNKKNIVAQGIKLSFPANKILYCQSENDDITQIQNIIKPYGDEIYDIIKNAKDKFMKSQEVDEVFNNIMFKIIQVTDKNTINNILIQLNNFVNEGNKEKIKETYKVLGILQSLTVFIDFNGFINVEDSIIKGEKFTWAKHIKSSNTKKNKNNKYHAVIKAIKRQTRKEDNNDEYNILMFNIHKNKPNQHFAELNIIDVYRGFLKDKMSNLFPNITEDIIKKTINLQYNKQYTNITFIDTSSNPLYIFKADNNIYVSGNPFLNCANVDIIILFNIPYIDEEMKKKIDVTSKEIEICENEEMAFNESNIVMEKQTAEKAEDEKAKTPEKLRESKILSNNTEEIEFNESNIVMEKQTAEKAEDEKAKTPEKSRESQVSDKDYLEGGEDEDIVERSQYKNQSQLKTFTTMYNKLKGAKYLYEDKTLLMLIEEKKKNDKTIDAFINYNHTLNIKYY